MFLQNALLRFFIYRAFVGNERSKASIKFLCVRFVFRNILFCFLGHAKEFGKNLYKNNTKDLYISTLLGAQGANSETRGQALFYFTISGLGYFTCITQHTGPTALRPIRRTKQLSVLLKDSSTTTGIRTHINNNNNIMHLYCAIYLVKLFRGA